MKECPNCKAMVPDVAKFCIKCRFNIKEYEEKQQNQPLFCMECGAEIVEGAAFCMECGADVVTVEAESVASQASINDGLEIDLSMLNQSANDQLYAQNGLKVENGVLVEYIGKRRSVTCDVGFTGKILYGWRLFFYIIINNAPLRSG